MWAMEWRVPVRYGTAGCGLVRRGEKQEGNMAKAAISEPSNGARTVIETELPYIVHIKIVGSANLLLHAWNCDSVEAKGKAKKGSEAKKSDDLESYVMRNDDGLDLSRQSMLVCRS